MGRWCAAIYTAGGCIRRWSTARCRMGWWRWRQGARCLAMLLLLASNSCLALLLTGAGCLAIRLLAGDRRLAVLLLGACSTVLSLLAGSRRLAVLLLLTSCFARIYRAAISTLFNNIARGQYKLRK